MRLLLDTHILLWVAMRPDRLSPEAAALIANDANALFFSAISVLEIAIKFARGRPDFTVEPHAMRTLAIENGYEELPVTGSHAALVADLPAVHGDPFDRLLVAQARAEGMALLTSDAAVARYGGGVMLV